jgi:nicotinic acid mononucleotide adenylyltransferase
MKIKIAIMVGSFKPFQKGHELILKKANDYSNNKILIFISSKERDCINTNNIKQELDLLKEKYSKLEYKIANNPIKELIEYLEANKENNVKYKLFLGKDRKPLKTKLKTMFPALTFNITERKNDSISGTKMRKWLKNNCKYSFIKKWGRP